MGKFKIVNGSRSQLNSEGKLEDASGGGGGDYTLPAASAITRGGVRVGANLSIVGDLLAADDMRYDDAPIQTEVDDLQVTAGGLQDQVDGLDVRVTALENGGGGGSGVVSPDPNTIAQRDADGRLFAKPPAVLFEPDGVVTGDSLASAFDGRSGFFQYPIVDANVNAVFNDFSYTIQMFTQGREPSTDTAISILFHRANTSTFPNFTVSSALAVGDVIFSLKADSSWGPTADRIAVNVVSVASGVYSIYRMLMVADAVDPTKLNAIAVDAFQPSECFIEPAFIDASVLEIPYVF